MRRFVDLDSIFDKHRLNSFIMVIYSVAANSDLCQCDEYLWVILSTRYGTCLYSRLKACILHAVS